MLHSIPGVTETESFSSKAASEFVEVQNDTLTSARPEAIPSISLKGDASTSTKTPRKHDVNSTGHSSFEEILPSKVTPGHNVQGRRIDVDAVIITSDDYMKK